MRRVGGSSSSNPYHSEANESQTGRSDASSRRSTRSSDSRFDELRSRHGATSELGSVASEFSEAGGSRSRYSGPSSSSAHSGTRAAPSEFRPTLPSVAEALSEAGSTRSTQVGELLSLVRRLSVLSEEERERDPAFSEAQSLVVSLMTAGEQAPSTRRGASTRASTTSSRQSTVASVAPSSQAGGSRQETRGVRDWPRHLHPFTADPAMFSLPPSEPGRSHTETLERRIARRRRTRPNLASQISRSTDSSRGSES